MNINKMRQPILFSITLLFLNFNFPRSSIIFIFNYYVCNELRCHIPFSNISSLPSSGNSIIKIYTSTTENI